MSASLAWPASAAEAVGEVQAAEVLVGTVVTRPGSQNVNIGSPELGVRRAVERLNSAGGVLGRPVRVITADDDCTRAGGEAAARELVASKAAVVVGHVCASAAMGAATVYAKANVLFLAPHVRHPALTTGRASVATFRVAGRNDRFGADTAAYILRGYSGARVAIVHDKSVEARTLAGALEDALSKGGTKPVLREAITAGERQYHAVAEHVRRAEADIVVLPALPIEARIVMQRLSEIGSPATIIGSAVLAVPEFTETAAAARQSVVLMLPWQPSAPARENGDAAALFAEAALEAWAGAAGRVGSLDQTMVARSLETTPEPTIIGALGFDVRGDARIPSFAPHVWRKDRWVPMDR